MDNIEISNMTLPDLDSISDILTCEFDDFWNYNIFKSELENKNSKYIVAKLNSEIVGFGGIWFAVDDIHITNIVVKKRYRNKKIGTLILNNLIEMCRNQLQKSITLEVNANNIPAQKLYENSGFKTVGIRKKYYNNTDDAIIMTKVL
ncbi:MAG: ribosomal protein S18-alanine N-acetyltransferase [Clostridia bacterium]|nr:ribosomal protein S18-alanine N-acetyltransferase [Clostridia bacterium]